MAPLQDRKVPLETGESEAGRPSDTVAGVQGAKAAIPWPIRAAIRVERT